MAKNKFDWKMFHMTTKNPRELVQCRWPISPQIYVFYRIAVALYSTIFCAYRFYILPIFWCTYTQWGYILIALSFTVKAIAAIKYYSWLPHHAPPPRRKTVVPRLLKFSWLLTNISTPVSYVVTTVYYALIYPPDLSKFIDWEIPFLLDFQVHGVNAILTTIDLFMINIPYRFSHAYQALLYSVFYGLFNLVFWIFTGVIIYDVMDWNRPITIAVFPFIALSYLLLIQFILVRFSEFLNSKKTDFTHSRKTT